MKVAVLSDIHANLPALTAVLSRLEGEKPDRVVCLGDIVGYGASPNECCELVRGLAAVVVRGNHDYAAVVPGEDRWFTPAARECIRWTRRALTRENREFLSSLEPFAEFEDCHLCHGSLFDPDFYTTTPFDAVLSLERMVHRFCFYGHTHYAEWFVGDGSGFLPARHPATTGGVLRAEPGVRYLVNVGSVGQPRDGNAKSSFGVWDTEAGTVTVYRVPYDVERAQELMEVAGLPRGMATRLEIGV